jgi:nitrile hydratase accessory protein
MSELDTEAARRAIEAVPSIPQGADGPVFGEPWEAQSFAITLAMHEQGLFTWSEWTQALAREIKRAQEMGDPDTGETYYQHWVAALERVVADKNVTDRATLERYHRAWRCAANRTPHGEPIVLDPDDFAS